MAAEYIVSSGNPNVILCERGIRTFETYTRNTLDLAAVPAPPPPDPPAGDRRPVPRHRQALADQADGDGRRGGRRRRGHGRGPPAPGRGPVRRRAVDHPGPVRATDDQPARDPRPGRRPARRPRPAQRRAARSAGPAALTAHAPPNLAGGPEPDVAGVRAGGPPARRAAPARRQVDQPSGAAPGGPGRR